MSKAEIQQLIRPEMRQTKTHFAVLYILLAVFGASCSKKFDEHYNPTTADKNIVEILSEDADHSEFVKIIDKLGLRATLGESAIYTCLAPTNQHVKAYLEGRGFTSIDQVPELELRQYVNGHFLNGSDVCIFKLTRPKIVQYFAMTSTHQV